MMTRNTTTGTMAAELECSEREAEGIKRLAFLFDSDESDDGYEARLNECRANDAAAR